jgi:hypothetical protein
MFSGQVDTARREILNGLVAECQVEMISADHSCEQMTWGGAWVDSTR